MLRQGDRPAHLRGDVRARRVRRRLFDYRNFGDSDGARRQHIDPHLQIEDYRNAISFAETLEEVDPERIGVWGLSYSGGHSLVLTAVDPRVKCAVSQIPVVDGYLNMRLANGTVNFRRLQKALLDARRHRFATGEDVMVPHFTKDTGSEISAWPFPEGYDSSCTSSTTRRRTTTSTRRWSRWTC